MDLSKFQFFPGVYKNQRVIWIVFSFDVAIKNELRQKLPYAKWSQSEKKWYVRDIPAVRETIGLAQNPISDRFLDKIHPVNQTAMLDFIDQLTLKSYSKNTIRTYCTEFCHLLALLKHQPVTELSPERLKSYFLYCAKQEAMKERKLNSNINAVKFYFEQVLHRPKMFFDIPRPKKPKSLPKMLTPREIKLLFDQVENKKHLLALQLCYGMGLRVSEVVNLKLEHINSKEKIVNIICAKGKKDRNVPLPSSIIPLMRNYYFEYQPKEYLLEGQYGGRYSKEAVQSVFRNAMRKAKIYKKIGVHGLRHSYATHLLQQGTDIRFIQELLGHHNIKTTMAYTHVAPGELQKVKSPLDNLKN